MGRAAGSTGSGGWHANALLRDPLSPTGAGHLAVTADSGEGDPDEHGASLLGIARDGGVAWRHERPPATAGWWYHDAAVRERDAFVVADVGNPDHDGSAGLLRLGSPESG